ncbi:MAG TPA: prenyltransferase [Usitatibacter sp.]|nr:prenyltransferase [Usitatibacter sp.]
MDSRLAKSGLAAAALAFGLAACAHTSDDVASDASAKAALSDPGHVVTGGSTAGTLSGGAVGGIVGHEVSKP